MCVCAYMRMREREREKEREREGREEKIKVMIEGSTGDDGRNAEWAHLTQIGRVKEGFLEEMIP